MGPTVFVSELGADGPGEELTERRAGDPAGEAPLTRRLLDSMDAPEAGPTQSEPADRPLSPEDIAPPSIGTFVRSQLWRSDGLLASLLLNGAAPFVAYTILTQHGFAAVRALALTAAFPILGLVLGWLRTRRADAIALLSLVFIAIGLAGSLITNDPRFYLVRVSFGTAAFGLVCLASLLFRRPLLFYLSRQTVAAGQPERAAYFDSLWVYPRFRHLQRVLTATWGVGYLMEASARVAIAVTLPAGAVLVLEPLLGYSVFIGLMVWTLRYARMAATDRRPDR
jgi:hypothetical protein